MGRVLVLLPAVSAGVRVQSAVFLLFENSKSAECVLTFKRKKKSEEEKEIMSFNERDAEIFVQLVLLMDLLGWMWSQEDYKYKCPTMYFV